LPANSTRQTLTTSSLSTILGNISHHPRSVLFGVLKVALMGIKLRRDIGLWIGQTRGELSIAAFAHANRCRGFLYDLQTSLCHDNQFNTPPAKTAFPPANSEINQSRLPV